MAASAFTRFDPRAFLENQKREGSAAKIAKPAKVPPERTAAFATFATFADERIGKRNREPPTETWTDTHDERAAIIEYDAGVPRAWAEALARLDATTPPGDVLPGRWRQFIDDCGAFLDAGWGERAAALGWRALDLFGCDRERPWARIDNAGLLWLLDGRKLIALTAETATIESSTNARQTYYRAPVEKGRVVLAWELLANECDRALGTTEG
jgi:hypothetical protein